MVVFCKSLYAPCINCSEYHPWERDQYYDFAVLCNSDLWHDNITWPWGLADICMQLCCHACTSCTISWNLLIITPSLWGRQGGIFSPAISLPLSPSGWSLQLLRILNILGMFKPACSYCYVSWLCFRSCLG